MVQDKATFHTSKRTQELVEQVGCVLLFVAPCWPDLNPMEKLGANLKRRWCEGGGSLDGLIQESDYSWDWL